MFKDIWMEKDYVHKDTIKMLNKLKRTESFLKKSKYVTKKVTSQFDAVKWQLLDWNLNSGNHWNMAELVLWMKIHLL